MVYYVYIIYSPKTDRYYTGSTDNPESRLNHHNGGHTPSTRSGAPDWKIVYLEEYPDRTAALRREKHIKKMKSRIYIENLIKNWNDKNGISSAG